MKTNKDLIILYVMHGHVNSYVFWSYCWELQSDLMIKKGKSPPITLYQEKKRNTIYTAKHMDKKYYYFVFKSQQLKQRKVKVHVLRLFSF